MMFKTQRFFNLLQYIIGILILTMPLLITGDAVNHLTDTRALVHYLLFCSIFITFHLLHRYFIFPKFYVEGKTKLYFLCVAIIISAIIYLRPFDKLMFEMKPNPFTVMHKVNEAQLNVKPITSKIEKHRRGPKVDVLSFFLLIIIVTADVITETNKQLHLTTKRALSAEAEKSKAELSFLKAQVNPHFLFNTLNNIYTLAIIKDENTAPSIMKLSSIMRYITDEAGDEFVYLRNEINCIENFISLHKLRLGKKTELTYECIGSLEKDIQIAPLILMAFVENVFKYGISNHKTNELIIKLSITDNILNFFTQNPIHPDKKKPERSGIGLTNTRKRLQLIYPDKHVLDVNDKNNLFTVKLTIHL